MTRRKLSRKKRFIFSVIIFLIPATAIAAIYVAYVAYRTSPLYSYVKSNQRGWKGKTVRADKELGFVPVPDSRGAMVFPIGDDIPVRFNRDGFRVPVDDGRSTSPIRHPIVLALGCSFTFGDATAAEDTYPYLVGQDLDGSTRNAGVGSYGLSQMLVLSKRLVPTYKPDYLLVQYSPWLVDRARSPFAPTYFGSAPTPYFFVEQNELALHPPVFMTKIMDLPFDRYRNTPSSLGDRVSFLWHVGLPLYVHDDYNMAFYKIENLFGFVPEPATNPEQVTKYVYEEMAKVARENGARLFIVILGSDHVRVPIRDGLFPSDSIIINAHDSLLEHLPVVNKESYEGSYFHWRGYPPVLVDTHPNENAHRIIAEAILQKIQEATRKQAYSRGQRVSGAR